MSTNLDALHECMKALTLDQQRALVNHLLGAVANVAPDDEWAKSLTAAEAFARRSA